MIKTAPTAEGALQIAMENMPITLAWSNSLVIGNGRIGKVLSKKLYLLGSNVTVCARKEQDFADIASNNLKFTDFKQIDFSVQDVIFNTVPECVLSESILQKMPQNTLIIDLASKPGGVDFAAANRLNKNVIWALSLPGKFAPKTAAKFVFETIIAILDDLEVK